MSAGEGSPAVRLGLRFVEPRKGKIWRERVGVEPTDEVIRPVHKRVAREEYGGRIRFLGVHDDAPLLLAESDVLTLMEAMASGLPVAAFDVGGVRDFVIEE